MKRTRALAVTVAAGWLGLFLLGDPAHAQLPPSNALVINQTQIQGGSNGNCLFINGSVLGSQACGGSGTVTSVSVVTANGISGSVATATTTPAITLTLGAITPTSVNGNTITIGTGTLTLGSVTLNAGAGGTLGSNAFTSTAYLPLTGGTLTGALLFSADNTIDVGASGATRPRTGYYGTSIITPLIIGGSGTTGTQFTLQTTTGAGTTDQFAFNGGNNGATSFGLLSSAGLVIGSTLPGLGTTLSGAAVPFAGAGPSTVFAALRYPSPGALGAIAQLTASRGAAPGTFAALQAGDGIGAFAFQGDNGANYLQRGATIRAVAVTNWNSSTNSDAKLVFATSPTGTFAIVDALTIQQSGGLQIGLTQATLAASEFGLNKIAASGSAPGAGTAKMAFVAGTNANTCKLIAYAGTSTTPVTIVDNVGAGC